MENRHCLIPYALQTVPRPGSREIRAKPAPPDMRIRNVKEAAHGNEKP